jgi:hypothetical protein
MRSLAIALTLVISQSAFAAQPTRPMSARAAQRDLNAFVRAHPTLRVYAEGVGKPLRWPRIKRAGLAASVVLSGVGVVLGAIAAVRGESAAQSLLLSGWNGVVGAVCAKDALQAHNFIALSQPEVNSHIVMQALWHQENGTGTYHLSQSRFDAWMGAGILAPGPLGLWR